MYKTSSSWQELCGNKMMCKHAPHENACFIKKVADDCQIWIFLNAPWESLQEDFISILNIDCKLNPHLGTGRGVPVSAFYLCSAPSAIRSWFHSSARLSRTPASPASVSRWPHSDCLCRRSATAMRNTACWHNNRVIHEGFNSSQVSWRLLNL